MIIAAPTSLVDITIADWEGPVPLSTLRAYERASVRFVFTLKNVQHREPERVI